MTLIGEAFFPYAPDLAVEILSPDESAMEVQDKVENYFQASSKMVWVWLFSVRNPLIMVAEGFSLPLLET